MSTELKKVDRFSLVGDRKHADMVRYDDGEYVAFGDYASLEKKHSAALRLLNNDKDGILAMVGDLASLHAENERLRAALDTLVFNVAGEQEAEQEIEKVFGRGVAWAVAAARAALEQRP